MVRRSIARNRPDGRRTRRASASPASRSRQWCTVDRDHSTVADRSGRGNASAAPSTKRTARRRRPGSAEVSRATRSISTDGSMPTTEDAPAAAARRAATPGPQPTSTTSSSGPTSTRRTARSATDRRPRRKPHAAARPLSPEKPGWCGVVVRCRCGAFELSRIGHVPTLTIEPGFKSSGGMDDELLTIGEVARRAGVATSTVRYYERRGLLRPDTRPLRPASLPRRHAAPPRVHRDAPGRRAVARRRHRGARGRRRRTTGSRSPAGDSTSSTTRSPASNGRAPTSPARCCAATTTRRPTARSWAARSIAASP